VTVKRGEVWLANLDPTQGSEQAGIRPVIVFQNELINKYSRTVLAIPLTTNPGRASLPSCLLISKGDGGLASGLGRPMSSIASPRQVSAAAQARNPGAPNSVGPRELRNLHHRYRLIMAHQGYQIEI
jgi:mRNA-degrading endonuclease toxin of MazEF toxin-antitoxin module